MFKKEYQGGSHVMVLTAKGRDPTAHCKLTGSVSHRYDKAVRGYIHVLEGDSIATRLLMPASDRWTLGLEQPFLVVQAAIERDARFSLELCLQEGKGGRRRMNFSTSVKEPSTSSLIARIPFVVMTTGQWCNYCFDLPALVGELFPGHTHKSLESLAVGGACLLRRVFTLKERPSSGDINGDLVNAESVRDIPAVCQMVINHSSIPTQMMSSMMASGGGGVREQKTTATATRRRRVKDGSSHRKLPSSSSSSNGHPPPPTHMAFGKMVPIPDHILARQTSSRSARNERNKSRLSEISSRQSSAPQLVRGGVATVEGVALHGRSQKATVRQQEGNSARQTEEKRKQQKNTRKPLANDELIALDALKLSSRRSLTSDFESVKPHTTLATDSEDRDNNIGKRKGGAGEEEEEGRKEGEKEEVEEDEELFSYFSPPKSAANAQTRSTTNSHSRGVQLEQDFLLNTTLRHHNEQGLPQYRIQSDEEEEEQVDASSDDEDKVNHNINDDVMDKGIPLAINETRLSQDYDWRQYASQEVDTTPLGPSSSSYSPTESPPPPQSRKTLLQLPTTHCHGKGATTPEPDTSTLSMTDKPHPLLDTLDAREMGGALSPLDPAENHLVQSDVAKEKEEEEELELMYDPQLHCFYDPNTHKYYKLIQ